MAAPVLIPAATRPEPLPGLAEPQNAAYAITFRVHGKPQTAGSKRAFVKNGRAIVVDDNARSREWKNLVADAAVDATPLGGQLLGAVRCELTFYLARPQGHFGTGRNAGRIKDSAPAYPATRPDVDKLSRAVLDACTGIVWRDDGQVVEKVARKVFAERPGVLVEIEAMCG